MKKLFNSLLDLIFPPSCAVCRTRSEEALCSGCFSQVKFLKPHLGVYVAAAYDGVVKDALHRFKFQRKKRLAGPLGVLLVEYLTRNSELKLKEIDAIIPVPLHRQRERGRGFNQVELLARQVSRYFELPVVPALERIKNTKPQFELPKAARLINIKGAFRVTRQEAVYNKRVILLDDIYTTGATITECCLTLKSAGVRRIEILTLARATGV